MVARRTTSTAEPLDRELLLQRFDGIRQFAQGGKRAPHKPLLLLYALGRLKQDRVSEIRFNAAEATVRPLLQSYGPENGGEKVGHGSGGMSPLRAA